MILSHLCGSAVAQQVHRMWSGLDNNGNGLVSLAELDAWLPKVRSCDISHNVRCSILTQPLAVISRAIVQARDESCIQYDGTCACVRVFECVINAEIRFTGIQIMTQSCHSCRNILCAHLWSTLCTRTALSLHFDFVTAKVLIPLISRA